tara:strand:- start:1395 stop:1709 length:315 start_codon:yes stop_codon:yes gene_type:complete
MSGDSAFGARPDGTPKGKGWFGPLRHTSGDVSTELSIGINFDGKERLIPAIVPNLTKSQLQILLDGKRPTNDIIDKAVEFARKRIKEGKSPFAEDGEQLPPPLE